MTWSHLSQLPETVRVALAEAEQPFRAEDEQLERATVRVLRQERLRSRIPVLVQALLDRTVPLRRAIAAVALHTGLSEGHVRRLYYERKPPQASNPAVGPDASNPGPVRA